MVKDTQFTIKPTFGKVIVKEFQFSQSKGDIVLITNTQNQNSVFGQVVASNREILTSSGAIIKNPIDTEDVVIYNKVLDNNSFMLNGIKYTCLNVIDIYAIIKGDQINEQSEDSNK